MTEEELQRQKTEQLQDMFATKGWAVLMELVEDSRKPLLDIRNVKDANDVHFRRGKVHALDALSGLPALIEQYNNAV